MAISQVDVQASEREFAMISRTIPGKLLQRTLLMADVLKHQRINWDRARQNLSQLRTLPPVAVHESAHALTTWLSPTVWTVLKVSASPKKNLSGHCISLRPMPMCEPAIWEDIVYSISGMAAERFVWPESKLSGSEMDVELVMEMTVRLSAGSIPPWNHDENIAIPEAVWEEELWRAKHHQHIVGRCYRRAMALIASRTRSYIRLCHQLNNAGTLHTPNLLLILGRRPTTRALAAFAAQAFDTVRELPLK